MELFVAMNPVERVTTEHADVLTALGGVIDSFAAEVRLLEARQDALLRERTQFAVDKLAITPPEADWRENADLVDREHALRKAYDAIAAGLSEAEDRAVSQINALARETYRISAGSSLFPAALTGSAAWATVLASFDEGIESTGIGFLESLLRKSNLSEWAAAHPERLRALLDAAPSADLVREWWSTLDDDAHEALTAGVPLLVGNLNGIPLGDRAKANNLNIEAEIARLHRLNADLTTRYGYDDHYRRIPGTVAFAPTIAANTALIASYGLLLHDPKAIVRRDSSGTARPLNPAVVIAFDPVGESFIHYMGHLDATTKELPVTTTNIGVLVPGTMSNASNWRADLFRASNVLKALPDTGDAGMFTWVGGHFPQGLDAASSRDSKVLGPRLADFVNSVRPTTTAALTGIGYSYGGAVLGMAEKHGVQLDRSVSVAGAGLGNGVSSVVDYPSSSRIPHYSLMAPGDMLVGPSQGLQAGILGHGASPINPASGFIRLDTGWNDDAIGQTSGPVMGHSGVWQRGSTSVMQVARVLNGEPVALHGTHE
ncbi:hypothetical protein [Frondihabitans sucicola]|nr:hypothetical protein [Frondihabitans sucicola]